MGIEYPEISTTKTHPAHRNPLCDLCAFVVKFSVFQVIESSFLMVEKVTP